MNHSVFNSIIPKMPSVPCSSKPENSFENIVVHAILLPGNSRLMENANLVAKVVAEEIRYMQRRNHLLFPPGNDTCTINVYAGTNIKPKIEITGNDGTRELIMNVLKKKKFL